MNCEWKSFWCFYFILLKEWKVSPCFVGNPPPPTYSCIPFSFSSKHDSICSFLCSTVDSLPIGLLCSTVWGGGGNKEQWMTLPHFFQIFFLLLSNSRVVAGMNKKRVLFYCLYLFLVQNTAALFIFYSVFHVVLTITPIIHLCLSVLVRHRWRQTTSPRQQRRSIF